MNKRFLSAVLFGALLASSTGTFTSCKDYDDDINGLQEQIDANKKTLDEKSAALQTALDAAKQEVAAAKAAADAAKTAADAATQAAAAAREAAATAKADAIAEAQKLVNELKAVVEGKVDQSVYDAKMAAVDAQLNVIEGKLADLETAKAALDIQIAALENFKNAIEALNLATTFPELVGKVDAIRTELNGLNTQVTTNSTDIAALKKELENISPEISGVSTALNTLESLLSRRLTALTFAPTSFINGIEVINFATLQYKPWTVTLADATDGTRLSTINNDGATVANYFVNPTSVTDADVDVAKLTILTQDASNTITRAVAPVTVTGRKIVGGKMAVNLKKNTTEPFTQESVTNADGTTTEKFILVALQAEIQPTDAEVANNITPVVTSDWARLAETSVTPYIHNAEYKTTDPETEDIANGVIPHFYNYTTIHDAGTATGICTTDGKYIIKNLDYTTSLDLNTLVAICDQNGARYDKDAYGLEFKFNLVDYYLRDGSSGEEKTNQKSFAKIDDKGVITSTSRNGLANNKDAIGREPLVQILLLNKANGEVVDVRYFKIAWTAKQESTPLGNLDNFNDDFVCGQVYVNTIGTELMNDKVYSVAIQGGISKDEFHTLYVLDSDVYASEDHVKAGTPAATKLGTLEDIPAAGSTTTHNLKWTLDIAQNNITMAEYNAGKAVRTVYGRYYRRTDKSQVFYFSMSLTLDIAKMEFVAGYNQPYWSVGALSNTNIDKKFQVNPALTDDANYGISLFYDCQIIADMLKGYNKTASVITTPLDLVSNATSARLIFDEDRLSLLGAGDWYLSGNQMTLYKGNVAAATIDGGVIRLFENPVPTVSTPGVATDPAQELLGKDVPVKLVATNCADITVELDHFLVNFINPLEMALGDITESFRDLMTGGSTIRVDRIATIKETFGLKRTVWANGAEVTPANKLVQWYKVGGVTWDLTKATTNLKKNGNNIEISNDVKASAWSEFKDQYVLEANPAEAGATELTFRNNSGAHIQQAFQIAVPVYVQTKWSPSLADPTKQIVVLTVNP